MVLGKKKYSTKIKKPNSSVSKYLYDLWFTVKIQLAKKDLLVIKIWQTNLWD